MSAQDPKTQDVKEVSGKPPSVSEKEYLKEYDIPPRPEVRLLCIFLTDCMPVHQNFRTCKWRRIPERDLAKAADMLSLAADQVTRVVWHNGGDALRLSFLCMHVSGGPKSATRSYKAAAAQLVDI